MKCTLDPEYQLRLDIWLVKNQKAPSRERAKRMIKSGCVKVNGKTVKPSICIKGSETIEISSKVNLNPFGYQKLKALDVLMNKTLAIAGETALDIGSSAGGFLLYLAEKKVHSTGIEISSEFYPVLKKIEKEEENITILFDNAFTIDTVDFCCVDLLLIDVTTEPSGTLKLIEKFLPLLKPGGKLVVAFKTKSRQDIDVCISPILEYFSAHYFFTINPKKEETHLVAIKSNSLSLS